MPKVSVIIPVYNVERYLGGCLDSVLGQSLGDIEVVCVLNGSTDGSGEILSRYASRDPRLKVLTSPPSNAGAARNQGISSAHGEYLSFCDADDWMDRGMLARMYGKARATSSDVVVTGFFYYDERQGTDYRRVGVSRELLARPQPFPPDALGPELFSSFRVQAWNKLFRREFIEGHGLDFQEQPRVNDLAFVATALALAERISVVDSVCYHYRKNQGGNLCSGVDALPEMSALAWLRVKEDLTAHGVFPRFRVPFCRAASHSLYEVVVSMRDAAAMEKFFVRAQTELIPALGITRDLADEAAWPFFDDSGPLPMIIDNLTRTRRRRDELQARVFSFRNHPLASLFRLLRRRFS